MFLSLVRPERISSPITSSAAVTCSAAVGEFAVAIDDPSAPGPTQQAIPTLLHCERRRSLPARSACKQPTSAGLPYLGAGPNKGQIRRSVVWRKQPSRWHGSNREAVA